MKHGITPSVVMAIILLSTALFATYVEAEEKVIECSPGIAYGTPETESKNPITDEQGLRSPDYGARHKALQSIQKNMDHAKDFRQEILDIANTKMDLKNANNIPINDIYNNHKQLSIRIDELTKKASRAICDCPKKASEPEQMDLELKKLLARSAALDVLRDMAIIGMDADGQIYQAFKDASEAGVSWIRNRGLKYITTIPGRPNEISDVLLRHVLSTQEDCEYVRNDAIEALANMAPYVSKEKLVIIAEKLAKAILKDKSPLVRLSSARTLAAFVLADSSYDERGVFFSRDYSNWIKRQNDNTIKAISILLEETNSKGAVREDFDKVGQSILTLMRSIFVPRPVTATIIANAALENNDHDGFTRVVRTEIEKLKAEALEKKPSYLEMLIEYRPWVIGFLIYLSYAFGLLFSSYFFPVKVIEFSIRIPSIPLPIPKASLSIPLPWIFLLPLFQSRKYVLKAWVAAQATKYLDTVEGWLGSAGGRSQRIRIEIGSEGRVYDDIDTPEFKRELSLNSGAFRVKLIGSNDLTSKAAYSICERILHPDPFYRIIPMQVLPVKIPSKLPNMEPEKPHEAGQRLIHVISGQLNAALGRTNISDSLTRSLLEACLIAVVFDKKAMENPSSIQYLMLPVQDTSLKVLLVCEEQEPYPALESIHLLSVKVIEA